MRPIEIGPADAALAYALWDAENSTRMDYEFLEKYIEHASSIRYWLKLHGYDVVKKDHGSLCDEGEPYGLQLTLNLR